jgi:hypothetical protein
MILEIDKHAKPSAYQPSNEIIAATKTARDTYATGEEILNKSWAELNYRSVLDDEDRGQMMMNAFVDESNDDPNEAWKWRGTRSMARNKGIAMHANLTSAMLVPIYAAQNEDDELDRDFSDYMRSIVEWMTYPENSDYQAAFLNAAFGMMDSPATFMLAEYCEVMMDSWQENERGEMEMKEIPDEVLSGFKAPIYRANQVHISNAYERNMQKQIRIGKRRYAEKDELEAKYGGHENWELLEAGIRSIYNEADGVFYDIKDDDHPNLVEEYIHEERRADSGIPYLNGIYFGNDDVDCNPIAHRDNRDAPKYNVVPFGYQRIGRHFFYYKSMMNTLGWDNALYDAMSEIVMNNAILEQDPPTAFTGVDEIDTEVNFPGAMITMEDKDAKAFPIFPSKNFVAGFNALRETEKSMSDASLSDVSAGQLPEASQKAYSVATAAQAAKKIIGATAKSLAESVMQMGDLMKDIAINNITVPQAEELQGGRIKLKYKTFLLPNKTVKGKTMDKVVKFDDSLLGLELTPQKMKERNLALLEEVGYPDQKHSLALVNPEMFANFRYFAKSDIKELFQMNEEMAGALWQGLFTILRDDPYISQEDLRRNLLRPYQAEEIVIKPKEADPMAMKNPMDPNAKPVAGSQAGNMATSKALSTALPAPGA